MFHQKCAVCHVSGVQGTEPYGPKLSKVQVNTREAGVREYILNGGPRMPGFRYALEPRQLDAIIAYLKTLDTPPDRIVDDRPEL